MTEAAVKLKWIDNQELTEQLSDQLLYFYICTISGPISQLPHIANKAPHVAIETSTMSRQITPTLAAVWILDVFRHMGVG